MSQEERRQRIAELQNMLEIIKRISKSQFKEFQEGVNKELNILIRDMENENNSNCCGWWEYQQYISG